MAGKRIAVFSLLALAGLALALFATSGTHAQTYKPTFGYTVANNVHDAVSNTTNVIAIPSPDYNYEDSSLYTFTPIDGWSEAGTAIAIADEVGTLSAAVYVGILGGPCSVNLPPSFTLENASVSPTPELSSADMYWVLKDYLLYPVPYGAYDPNIPDYLEAMPHFINEMLDPDGRHGPDPPLTANARYAGFTTVAGMNIIIQFIVLEPGQITQLGGIKAQMGPELGQPSLVVLDNPISQEESPGAISDFCTPLSTTTVLLGTTVANQYDATGGGTVARTNPPENTGVLGTGTHMARNYSQSERDADGDGHENDLDPCHYTDDSGWNPRLGDLTPPTCNIGDVPGDDDCDGLPNSCDPKYTGVGTCVDPDPIKKDCDADGYNNRQDICPLVPSGCNTDACSSSFPKVWLPAWENMGDDEGAELNADLGPGPDSIGNACDDSNDDGMENGTGPNLGSGDCNDGIDNDADTLIDGNDPDCVPFMDAAGVGECRDAIDRDGDTKVNDGCPQKGAASESACDDAVDDDGDTRVNDGCPADGDPEDPGVTDLSTIWGDNPGTGQFYHAMPWTAVTINAAVDTDGDGYSDALECGTGTTWPTCDAGTLGSDREDSDSTPESLVIDMPLTVGASGLPSPAVPQSCSDGVDNDGDGATDTDNSALGCNTGHASYTGDTDYDGVADVSDNCVCIKNPEQTDSNTNSIGDACEIDRDGDAYADYIECYLPTDMYDVCPDDGSDDAWPLDIDMTADISVTGDVFNYVGKIGATPGSPNWVQRLDLDVSSDISVTGDVFQYVGKIGLTCS